MHYGVIKGIPVALWRFITQSKELFGGYKTVLYQVIPYCFLRDSNEGFRKNRLFLVNGLIINLKVGNSKAIRHVFIFLYFYM